MNEGLNFEFFPKNLKTEIENHDVDDEKKALACSV